MNINIRKSTYFQLLESKLIDEDVLDYLKRINNRFIDEYVLDVSKLSIVTLELVRDIAKAENNRAEQMSASSYINILSHVDTKRVSTLPLLVTAIKSLITKNFIDGWIYQMMGDGKVIPHLISTIEYHPKSKYNEAYVTLSAVNNRYLSKKNLNTVSFSFKHEDLIGIIHEVLAKENLFIESRALKDSYLRSDELFALHRPNFNKQYLVSNKAVIDTDHFNQYDDLLNSKCVNDESLIVRRNQAQYRSFSFGKIKNKKYDLTDDEIIVMEQYGIKESYMLNVPNHHYLFMFSLEKHSHLWVHVDNLIEYKYKPELRDKIVLPELHRDLIDILTKDLSNFSDFIEGKSGGTIILCKGAPGLGKTLTSEIYSEVIQKPLYRVHSGQLGDNADTIEKRLKIVMENAMRLNAVLLIDEADVFIRKRDNDIKHNAVVAAFLRTMEYYAGLMFMTTNRSDEVDDAIASRCIATIIYDYPKNDEVKRLWMLLAEQFNAKLTEISINQLVPMFKNISGRDIKELLKLSIKFANGKNIPLDHDVVRKVAVFRGVEFT